MNFFDVFPRRNLNPEAEPWGREVEKRIFSLENQTQAGDQSMSGLNRASAATMGNLANQLNELEKQIQRVEDLYEAIPKASQLTVASENFGLSAGWNTVATLTFNPPGTGTFVVNAQAHGQLVSSSDSTNMQASVRLVFQGTPSATVPGLPATPFGTWTNNIMIGWGVTSTVGLAPYTVQVQVLPVDAASWGAGTGSIMVLSANATFTPLGTPV